MPLLLVIKGIGSTWNLQAPQGWASGLGLVEPVSDPVTGRSASAALRFFGALAFGETLEVG